MSGLVTRGQRTEAAAGRRAGATGTTGASCPPPALVPAGGATEATLVAALGDTGLVRDAIVCAVVGEPEPRTVAYVAPVERTEASLAAVRVALRQRLGRAGVPPDPLPDLVAVADVPRDRSGAPDLGRLPPPPPPRPDDFPAPLTRWGVAVSAVWCRQLGLDGVAPDDDFFELGGSFRDTVSVLRTLREAYLVRVATVDFVEHPTFSGFVARTDPANERSLRASGHVVARLADGPRRPPLFLIPGAGGHGGSFLALARVLRRPVYGLQARGLEWDGVPHRSVEGLADHLVRTIRSVQPSGPYLVGGHSYGSVVALEVARRLVGDGAEVGPVVLLDPVDTGGDYVTTDALRLPLLEPGARPALRERVERTLRGNLRRARITGRVLANGLGRQGSSVRRDFYLYSMFLVDRFRPTPWPGTALVYWSDEAERTEERPDLADFLCGPRTEVDCRGSHLTMIDAPHASALGADLEARLTGPVAVT